MWHLLEKVASLPIPSWGVYCHCRELNANEHSSRFWFHLTIVQKAFWSHLPTPVYHVERMQSHTGCIYWASLHRATTISRFLPPLCRVIIARNSRATSGFTNWVMRQAAVYTWTHPVASSHLLKGLLSHRNLFPYEEEVEALSYKFPLSKGRRQ